MMLCVNANSSGGVAVKAVKVSQRLLFFFTSVCKGAKADVVFVIDGSWSIGEDSFTKVVNFVSAVIAAFDVVGPSGMQVCADRCAFDSMHRHSIQVAVYCKIVDKKRVYVEKKMSVCRVLS